MVTEDVLTQHNLTESDYRATLPIRKREPTMTELGIFSVMWSERSSYKSSRVQLGRLTTKGPAVLQGPGENAGIIDIGDGLAVAFKIESHNHPSAVEPFQGAATGVGGIIRDTFTMGARPVAAMNSLRFGPITDDGPHSRSDRGHPLPSSDEGRGQGDGSAAAPAAASGGSSNANGKAIHEASLATREARVLPEHKGASAPQNEIANRKSQIANNRRLF